MRDYRIYSKRACDSVLNILNTICVYSRRSSYDVTRHAQRIQKFLRICLEWYYHDPTNFEEISIPLPLTPFLTATEVLFKPVLLETINISEVLEVTEIDSGSTRLHIYDCRVMGGDNIERYVEIYVNMMAYNQPFLAVAYIIMQLRLDT